MRRLADWYWIFLEKAEKYYIKNWHNLVQIIWVLIITMSISVMSISSWTWIVPYTPESLRQAEVKILKNLLLLNIKSENYF